MSVAETEQSMEPNRRRIHPTLYASECAEGEFSEGCIHHPV